MEAWLNAKQDREKLRKRFLSQRFVQVAPILEETYAQQIGDALHGDQRWNLVFNQGNRHFDMDASQANSLAPEDLERLRFAVHAQAQHGFQYFYRNRPLYDEIRQRFDDNDPLHRFVRWLNSSEFLDFARAVTHCNDIGFADAQATCYSAGHFLSEHDDSADGKNRRAAYIFNFTPKWRPDWGGYLNLLTDDGDVERGLQPCYNALNLLAIPRPHSVGYVAPFADANRYAITGWLRAGPSPFNSDG